MSVFCLARGCVHMVVSLCWITIGGEGVVALGDCAFSPFPLVDGLFGSVDKMGIFFLFGL